MCIYCTTNNYRAIYENHIGLIPKEADGRTYEIHHIDGNHSNNSPSNLIAVTLQEHYDIHYAQGDWYACTLMKLQRMDYTPEEISILLSKSARKRVKNGTHPFLGGEIQRKYNLKKVEDGTHNFLDSEFQRKNAQKRVEEGTHHFLDGESARKRNYERINAGTHHFLSGDIQREFQAKMVENGTHKFCDSEFQQKNAQKRIENGTHNFLDPEFQRKNSQKRVEDGTHNFLGEKNPSHERIKKGTHNFLGENNASKIRCSCIWCKKETSFNVLAKNHNEKKCKLKT